MTLAASLMEGYGNYSNMTTVGTSDECIQNITTDFIMESSNLFQTYLTAEIIAQTQVVTEGSDPEVLLEGTVKSFLRKMWEAIKKFVKKMKDWIVGIGKKIKNKWKSWRSSKTHKAVKEELKKHDDDEKLKVPENAPRPTPPKTQSSTNSSTPPTSPKSDLYPIVCYDVDAGIDFMNEVITNMEPVVNSITDIFFKEDGDPIGKNRTTSLADFKEGLKIALGFDPDQLEQEITKVFGADKVNNTELTVAIIKQIQEDAEFYDKYLDDCNNIMNSGAEMLQQVERRWDTISNTLVLPDDVLKSLQDAYNCSIYACQLTSKLVGTAANIITAAVGQVEAVVATANMSLRESVAEGFSYDGFDEPVSEGVNTSVLKKYLYECKGYIKELKEADDLFGKEDYQKAKQAYKAVKSKMEKTNKELKDLAADADFTTDLIGGFTAIITSIIIGFDSFIRNAWINKDMMNRRDVDKAQDDTHGSRNPNITVVMARMNSCIERCDRQMAACDKRSGVSESSLFEQASSFVY